MTDTTKTFTASNGVEISRVGSEVTMSATGSHDSDYIYSDHEPALREFFLHERDKELGRWRWRDPLTGEDYLVRNLRYGSMFRVTSEVTAETLDWRPEQYNNPIYDSSSHCKAIRAYIAAHPESKPWHDAKHNELWELYIRGSHTPEVYRCAQMTTCADSLAFRPVNNPNRVWFEPTSKDIQAARRIYPEKGE